MPAICVFAAAVASGPPIICNAALLPEEAQSRCCVTHCIRQASFCCTADSTPQAAARTLHGSTFPHCHQHVFTAWWGGLCPAAATGPFHSTLSALDPFDVPAHAAGDQHGNIRVWDLTANACSCELVPEVGTAVRSITVALDGSLVVAANNAGTCYVWRMMRGASMTTHFEPLHKLRAHAGQNG